MELKEIESLSYVETKVSCDLMMSLQMWVFLDQRLQLNYSVDSMMVEARQLMVMVCLGQAAASNDCASAVANVLDGDVIIQFPDDLNDALVTGDLIADEDCHVAKAQVEMFYEVHHDDYQIILMLRIRDFLVLVQKHSHLKTMMCLLLLQLTLDKFVHLLKLLQVYEVHLELVETVMNLMLVVKKKLLVVVHLSSSTMDDSLVNAPKDSILDDQQMMESTTAK